MRDGVGELDQCRVGDLGESMVADRAPAAELIEQPFSLPAVRRIRPDAQCRPRRRSGIFARR
jgi:hypothetical protein